MVEHFSTNMSVTLTAGTELAVDESSPSTEYNLIATGTFTGSDKTWLFLDGGSRANDYTDWSSDTAYWK